MTEVQQAEAAARAQDREEARTDAHAQHGERNRNEVVDAPAAQEEGGLMNQKLSTLVSKQHSAYSAEYGAQCRE